MERNKDDYVVVIGGTNIDLQGFPRKKLIMKDSNIGSVKISLGGVGRNIAENLTRLGFYTKLISIIGDDVYGNLIMEKSREIGLDLADT